jgi:hypothetical protein
LARWRGGRIGEPSPAILDLLLSGQGVVNQGEGLLALGQRLAEALGGGLTADRRRVAEAVERLGQGQAIAADLGFEPAQDVVMEPRPVRHGRGAVDDDALEVRRQLVRTRGAHPAKPRGPVGGARMGGEGGGDLAVLELVELEGEE